MVPAKVILISDPEILRIPIQDNKEPLIDLLSEYPDIFVDISRENVQKISLSISLIRKSAAQKLFSAQKILPSGLRFKIKECYRPIFVQKQIFELYSNKLSRNHKDWDKARLYSEASKYVSPPEIIPPHSTGGAVDLTLMTDIGVELDMGTQFNAGPEECSGATFTLAENISDIARKNRKILINTLSNTGFVNYPAEWWHWSYGDRYWAYHTGASYAFYNAI